MFNSKQKRIKEEAIKQAIKLGASMMNDKANSGEYTNGAMEINLRMQLIIAGYEPDIARKAAQFLCYGY